MIINIEIQKNNDGSVALPPVKTFADRQQAEQDYHNTLAYAAVSQVAVHSVIMLDDCGNRIQGQTYYHTAEE